MAYGLLEINRLDLGCSLFEIDCYTTELLLRSVEVPFHCLFTAFSLPFFSSTLHVHPLFHCLSSTTFRVLTQSQTRFR